MNPSDLYAFVQESNYIENIFETRQSDILAHEDFLKRPLNVVSVSTLAYNLAGAPLRIHPTHNVMVAGHYPPPGGPKIQFLLEIILGKAPDRHPVETHQRFLWLHPFLDGNGRTARAIWLKSMIEMGQLEMVLRYGFLRSFYYQGLDYADRALDDEYADAGRPVPPHTSGP